MNAERGRQIERFYRSALQREPSQRDAFLAEACQGDEELRREIESRLPSRARRMSRCPIPTPALLRDRPAR